MSSSVFKRKSIRLKNCDYREPGAYFLTICTKDRVDHLGKMIEGRMCLNGVGEIVKTVWVNLPLRFPGIELDEFVIMPNHVHGIITIVGAPFMAPCPASPTGGQRNPVISKQGATKQGVINHAPTLGEMVRTFKALSTYQIRSAVTRAFAWQRNYYEHVIRDERDLDQIREYIQENPLKWDLDPENIDSDSYRATQRVAPTSVPG